MKKKWIAILLALAMLISCTAFAEEDGADPNMEELIVGSTTAMTGNFFSTIFGNNSSDMDVMSLLHGYNLVRWDNDISGYVFDESVVAGAVCTEDASGNHHYTITLKEDMLYSDGTQVTAWDYAFTMLLFSSAEIKAIGASANDTQWLVGAADWQSGSSKTLSGVSVTSDYLISITISKEALPFFYEMSLLDYKPYPISQIAPGCKVADDGNGVYIANIDENIEEPIFTAELLQKTLLDETTGYVTHPAVVSGPYTLLSFEDGVAQFQKNENYKGNYKGVKAEIKYLDYLTVSNDTLVDSFAAGTVELLNKVTEKNNITNILAKRNTEGDFAISNYTRSGLSFLAFCCEKPGVDSTALRQAIAHCLDKDALVSGYLGNYGVRVDGYYGMGQWMTQIVYGTLNANEDEEDSSNESDWEALSLDNVPTYEFNVDTAVQLLVKNGWTLNEEGNSFTAGEDTVRCKKIKNEAGEEVLVALDLKLYYPEEAPIGELLQVHFADHLAEAGIRLSIESKPFTELVEIYQSGEERDCDLLYLAENFSIAFEPSEEFKPQGENNNTRIEDEKLYQAAIKLRQTKSGDALSYMQNWLEFQERWAEVLPMIPIYSNVYFDFYTDDLHSYNIKSQSSWGEAIVESYLSDESDLEDQQDKEDIDSANEDDFEIIEGDDDLEFEDEPSDDEDLEFEDESDEEDFEIIE